MTVFEVPGSKSITARALFLAAALARPWADVVLSGAARVEHLRSNLAAHSVDWDGELDQALSPLAENPESYWATRSRLSWN